MGILFLCCVYDTAVLILTAVHIQRTNKGPKEATLSLTPFTLTKWIFFESPEAMRGAIIMASDPSEGCKLVSCPPENGQFALHLPNPLDCASFCKCDWGEAHYFGCPPGLHFNAELQVCDWPEQANCQQPAT